MATDYVIDGKIGIDLTAVYDSASAGITVPWPASPGDRVFTTNAGEYVFARAESAIATYDAVAFGSFGDSALASTGTFFPRAVPLTTAHVAAAGPAGIGPMVGVSQVSIGAGRWGWIAVNGTNLRVNALVACQPKVQLFTTATGGSIDDAVVSAGLIMGLTIITSATSASAPRCILNHPQIGWYAVQA